MPVFGERGQSGMIGFVIVVALVIMGAVLVVFAGSAAINDLQQERTDSEARFVMEDVDSQLTTITSSDQSATGQFSMEGLEDQEARTVRRGYLNVTVDRRYTCRTNVTLSSIRYESDDGETVAYEAGGVFLANDNGSAVQTPPDLQFRNGSLDITITNITGEVSDTRTEAFYNATSSERESARRSAKVVSGQCIRPDNVTVSVRSDFYRAWGAHLRDELNASTNRTVFANGTVRTNGTGVTVWTDPANRTATAYINQTRLPRRTDDHRNRVVNMSDPDYMDVVEIGDASNPYPPNSIRVSKGVSNDYTVYVEPLTETRLYIGGIHEVEGETNVTGPPTDVVFVLDESGSMSDPADDGASVNKSVAAQGAIRNFTYTLNMSHDRAGLVGYSDDWTEANVGPGGRYCDIAKDEDDDRLEDEEYWCTRPRPTTISDEEPAWIYSTNGRYLTANYTAFRGTVNRTKARHGTYASVGLSKANQLLHLKSNQSRQQIVIFLSDGKFNGYEMSGSDDANEAALERANISASQGITVYTIGFGDENDLNEDVLKKMANRTGGRYEFADNQSELNDIFRNISRNIAATKQLALTPTSTNVSTSNGGTFAPQVPGDTDNLASTTRNGQRFVNINDPTTPVPFSHSFAVSDGEAVRFNASTYTCDEWQGTNRRVTNTSGNDTESYQVLRCTDLNQTDYELPPENVTIYTDGDDISSLVDDSDDSAWWRQSIKNAINNRSRDEMYIDNTGPDPVLRADSNLAVVVLDYPNGPNSTNKMALIYRVGRAESEARADDVVNIRVRNVHIDD